MYNSKILSFDVEIAKQTSVNAAVLFQYISFWILKNKSNKRNFREGKYWTYITHKQMQNDIGFLTIAQIKYALDKLTNKGLLIKGEFNNSKYDHTKWYALGDAVEEQEQEQKHNTKYQANHKTENNGYNASEYLEAAMNDLLYIGEVEVKKKE